MLIPITGRFFLYLIRQITTVDDILNLKSSTLLEGSNADFRLTEAHDQADQIASFDPLSFFVGRVERTLDPKAEPVAMDPGNYIDREK
jgi:hypothetical protein